MNETGSHEPTAATPAAPVAVDVPAATAAESGAPTIEQLRIRVRPLPKVVFFYLTWITAFVAAVIASIAGDPAAAQGVAEVAEGAAEAATAAGSEGPGLMAILGTTWLGVFFFNLLAISYDFNEERTLIGLLGGVATGLFLLYFGWLGAVSDWFMTLHPVMNATFYWMVFAGFTSIYIGVWINSRLDYWEFRPNEVVHRYGLFPKMKRFSTEDLRWDKEVPDVLERLLLGSGRIVLTTPHERHPIVIQHVMRIGRIDDRIADILGVKAVIHTEHKKS
ncbi:MAG TPA: hypothetical protein VGC54_00425 [Planctomycetota bacterium]